MSGMPPFLLATLTIELADYLGAMSDDNLPVSLYTQHLVALAANGASFVKAIVTRTGV